jgi:hypothetical protein
VDELPLDLFGNVRALWVLRPVDPSYKLLSEYSLLLTQRLTSYSVVLVGPSCGSFSFAKVTDELPTSGIVVALRRKGD